MVLQCDWAQIQVIVLTNDGNGFGFGISGSRNSGAVVRNIFPGGAADRDGTLRNGDHLLAVGDVRLWGMGAEQVASILRQAGQDSIRLVVARPVDPSVPQFALNSTIVPTKVLTDPQELDRALASGLQAVSNGFAFDPQTGPFPEAYQSIMDVLPAEMPQPMLAGFTAAETMVVPTIITSSESTSASGGGAGSSGSGGGASSKQDNIALPPSTKSLVNPPSAIISTVTADTIVTHCSSKSSPQITVLMPNSANTSSSAPPGSSSNITTSESMIQIHSNTNTSSESANTNNTMSAGGQRVALVTSQSNPNKISIVPAEQISNVVIGGGGGCVTSNCVVAQQVTTSANAAATAAVHENPISDENSINQANRIQQQQPILISTGSTSSTTTNKPVHHNIQTKCKTSASCGTLKEECQSPNVKKRRKSANISSANNSAKSASLILHESDSTISGSANSGGGGDQSLPEKEEYKIQLKKDTNGLGITIAGYVCEKEDLCGIFVKSVIEGSMADRSGCIMVNDQITEVDGTSLAGITNQQAVEVLKHTGSLVQLTIVRYLRGLKFEELQDGIKAANVPTPTSLDYMTSSFLSELGGVGGNSEAKVVPTATEVEVLPALPSSASASTAGANSTSVTVSSLSGPSSQQSDRLSCCSSIGTNPGGNSSSTTTGCGNINNPHQQQQDLKTNHLSRGSPHSKSLKQPSSLTKTPEAKQNLQPQRRSVPNVLEDVEDTTMRCRIEATSAGTLKAEVDNSSSTTIHKEEDLLQLKWEATMGSKFTIVIARLRKPDASSGLGISLEGTVDVEDGKEVRPHHYIRSILPGGPIGLNGVLKSGDELLEVNGKCLKGLFHEEVVRTLKELPVDVCIVCARKVTGPSPLRGTIVDNVDPGRSEQAFASRKILSGSLQSLLASKEPEILLKAKSEVSLACTTSQSLSVELSTTTLGAGGSNTASMAQVHCHGLVGHHPQEFSPTTQQHVQKFRENASGGCSTTTASGVLLSDVVGRPHPIVASATSTTAATPSQKTRETKRKSQSLDQLNSQAMWRSETEEVVLEKGDKGLGFSILDYQDPLNTTETVIVVRSLVPGGIAHLDGRIVPGDRIIYVNQVMLEHASLDTAVQALKGAPFGSVRIGISRPLVDDNYEGQLMMGQLRERLAENETPIMLTTSTTTDSVRGSLSDTFGESSNISDLKTDCGDDVEEAVEEDDNSSDNTPHPTVDERLNSSVLNRGELQLAHDISILPNLPKYSICIKKGPSEFLGIQLEALAFELCGTVVRQIESESCVAKDGRLKTGDLILYLNHECLWRVTSSQAKTVLRRAELVSNSIPIVFVPEETLIHNEDSTEDEEIEEGGDFTHQSLSESLKLSDIEETREFSPDDIIQEDLTVQSAKTQLLKRFPSDLIESSVDPIEEENNMVRVYKAPSMNNSSRHAIPTTTTNASSPSVNGLQTSSTSSGSNHHRGSSFKTWGPPRTVEVKREAGTGLGLSIVGGKVDGGSTSGIFIKNVIPDSPAGHTGQLCTGDRIVQIGNQRIESSDQEVAVNAIKNAGNTIQFVVQSLQTAKRSGLDELEVLDKVSRLSIDPFQQNRRLSETTLLDLHSPTNRRGGGHHGHEGLHGGGGGNGASCQSRSESHSVAQSPPFENNSTASSLLDLDNPFQNDQLPVWQNQQTSSTVLRPTKVRRGGHGDGGSSTMTPTSPSETSSPDNNYGGQGRAYCYQNLNETPLSPDLVNHRQRLQQDCGGLSPPSSPVAKVIQHGLTDQERQKLQQKFTSKDLVSENPRDQQSNTMYKKSSLDRDNIIIEDDSTGGTYEEDNSGSNEFDHSSSIGGPQDRDDEEQLEETEEDIIQAENFKKLGGDVIEVDLRRNDYGFGIALAGHSNRNRMGTFICGIHPHGSAAEDGQLLVGDELLKIHRTVVRGRSHLNVSAIMKKAPNDKPVKITILRCATNMDKIAIKKFTQFPVKLDDVIFESPEFEKFLARREIKMQKTTEGLGIMIIEGSHKAFGKGIFVSDIQQNSLAFKASLKVGDMILAVNTESFLDITYDEAALILKQVTGNVRILVVNPKDEENKLKEITENSQTSVSGGGPEQNTSATTLSPNHQQATSKTSPSKSPSKDAISPTTISKSPAKSPGKSPVAQKNKKDDNIIELKKDAKGLGISIVGGSDTPLGGVIVHEVHKDGAADKDGRIKPGDFIISVDGKAFKDCTHKEALQTLRFTKEKAVKIIIDRKKDGTDLYQDLQVDLSKKPGKGLGLSVVGRRDGNGVFISDMVVGGAAETNGQLMRGDQIMNVNEQDLSESKQDQAVAILKTASGLVKIKVRRYKCLESST